ncbi:MAG TPA: CheR family methyltransferase [Candidatus Lokiarchaeia archaeon]|nr:CheR family methyltransferase [Candidatus Lokiarchaeia archaeon]
MPNDTEMDINITEENDKGKLPFPLVGIGASAGGIGALERFFENVPADSGMAFVILMHLDPTRDSIVASMVKKNAKIDVQDITDAALVEPNNAYMLPPNKNVRLEDGKLFLEKPDAPRGLRLPIDHFFRSLAKAQGEEAIGIVLSGTGTDGTLGLKEIKAHGGIVMVQDPNTTEYSGMPQSAIASISVDYVSSPEQLPGMLVSYVANNANGTKLKSEYSIEEMDGLLNQINDLIRDHLGREFSVYKKSTIVRRIERRMALNQINTLDEYVSFLKDYPLEIESLFNEVLIGVTHFFRDEDAFNALEEKVVSVLLKDRGEEDPIRVWVTGCSSGEEAYSIAMLLADGINQSGQRIKVQIYATDIDNRAIEKARKGVYPENILAELSPDKIEKYFIKEENVYRVKKSIRGMIVFAQQDTLSDPPFSNIDLISCRNLLIYLRPEIQKRLIELFHYSLKAEGFLFLGTAESITSFNELYEEIDRKQKIFRKKLGGHYHAGFPGQYPAISDFSFRPEILKPSGKKVSSYRELVENIILDNYSPSAAIVNSNHEILYIQGRTGKYLEPAEGAASMNILDMAREGLKIPIATAIRNSIATNETIRSENIRVKTNGDWTRLNLIVQPFTEPEALRGLFLIVFEERKSEQDESGTETGLEVPHDLDQDRFNQLETELKSTKQYLQTTIEELQTSNEELKSTNEELQSSNEELKSTNEELQTSKEELQSLNEELVTVNNELESKMDQLSEINDDLNNLISSTDIATIFIDTCLNIKRFTPKSQFLFNLIKTDIGRPLHHIASNFEDADFIHDIHAVIETLAPVEKDIKLKDESAWYTMRIVPYRTEENVIDGVVITFFDITMKKEAETEIELSNEKYQAAYKTAEFLKSLLMHDINNLLTIISLGASQIKENDDSDISEKSRGYLQNILKQVERGSTLVNNLRKITEIDGESVKIYPIDINGLIQGAISHVKQSHLESEDITIEVYPGDGKPLMTLGNDYLMDAIENIIINGIKYNNSSEKNINIDVDDEVEGEPGLIKVSITDNGIGMRDDMKQSIMTGEFSKKSDKFRGLGIGLTIVRQILEKLNGKFLIESSALNDYTKGTRFVLLLPKLSNGY